MIKDIIRMSFQNLKMNKIRTFLTTLGIIIGIASIIALITIGQGVTSSVIEQLSGLGGNRVTVSITDTKAIPGFTDSNLREFTALENVEGISPSLRSYKPVTLVPGETNSLYNYVYTSSASVMGLIIITSRFSRAAILKRVEPSTTTTWRSRRTSAFSAKRSGKTSTATTIL